MALPNDSDIIPTQTLPGLWQRLRRKVLGNPLDVRDRRLFHQMTLTPVLAWIGLGADALSSSAYGPEEAFKAIGDHTYLAVALAVATALTVGLISAAYSALVENFPNGGGYGVASKLLGEKAGLLSGSALLVDQASGEPNHAWLTGFAADAARVRARGTGGRGRPRGRVRGASR